MRRAPEFLYAQRRKVYRAAQLPFRERAAAAIKLNFFGSASGRASRKDLYGCIDDLENRHSRLKCALCGSRPFRAAGETALTLHCAAPGGGGRERS